MPAADALRRRRDAVQDNFGSGTRKVVHAAHGCPQARQRDPHPARPPEARPEGRQGSDPRAAARSAGVSADREGLRSSARGAEVRPREGEPDSHAVPDLAEQDDRRAVGAPAQRAGLLPAAITAADPKVLVVTGPSGVGKGTLIRTLRERVPGLELSISATTRRPRLGEQAGVDYHFLS